MQQSSFTVFEEPERTSLYPIVAYVDNGNSISSKRERIFLRNFLVICEFHSQSYSLVLRKQFANIILVESAKWDLGAQSGPWWKRKYPQIITREKLTERLLSDVWLHTQSSTLPFFEEFANSVILSSAKWYLGTHWRLWWKRKHPQFKTRKKPSEKLRFHVWMQLTEIHVSLQCSVC